MRQTPGVWGQSPQGLIPGWEQCAKRAWRSALGSPWTLHLESCLELKKESLAAGPECPLDLKLLSAHDYASRLHYGLYDVHESESKQFNL
jgi:hypothetical protein